jgi:glycosyltransferase involved in cell wall biosynthesis
LLNQNELIQELSVIVPCFNEEKTVFNLLQRVLSQSVVGQVIVIDDGSTDNSVLEISKISDPRINLLLNKKNMGKGRSIWRGIQEANRKYLIIQDADLEYDPSEYKKMLDVMMENQADVVYGSRFMTSGPRRAIYYWHSVGNSILTTLSNVFTNIYLTDMETCYKLMRTEIAQRLNLKENRFGIEPEITAKLAKFGVVIYEVPINYRARTYSEGKKIGWKDGLSAIRCIVKYTFLSPTRNRL